MTYFWLFVGGLIGLFAAERKKFNMLGGAAVGALLGPFAVLMFFASGPKMKTCPYCAEKILPEARVCKHCRKDLPVATGVAAKASTFLLIAVCALAGACSSESERALGTISSEQAQQLILDRDAARDAASARERELLGEIEQLRAENNDLRGQLGLAQESAEEAAARAEQYQAGLGKAVAKLNEVSQEANDAQRLVAANRAAAAAYRANERAQPEGAELSYFTTPQLSIVENSIMASGQFYNSGSAPARGTLYLDLVRNGEVIYTAQQRIIANQQSWSTWQQEFHATSNGAQLSVVPRFEAE